MTHQDIFLSNGIEPTTMDNRSMSLTTWHTEPQNNRVKYCQYTLIIRQLMHNTFNSGEYFPTRWNVFFIWTIVTQRDIWSSGQQVHDPVSGVADESQQTTHRSYDRGRSVPSSPRSRKRCGGGYPWSDDHSHPVGQHGRHDAMEEIRPVIEQSLQILAI